jgi:hypothetical protein
MIRIVTINSQKFRFIFCRLIESNITNRFFQLISDDKLGFHNIFFGVPQDNTRRSSHFTSDDHVATDVQTNNIILVLIHKFLLVFIVHNNSYSCLMVDDVTFGVELYVVSAVITSVTENVFHGECLGGGV